MSLDKDFLYNFIMNILEAPPDTVESAAESWARAIVEYAMDAEFIGTAPGIAPWSGLADPSPIGSKFKVNSGLVKAGQSILEPALLNGFKMEDPFFIGLQLGIASFIPTLTIWSALPYTAVVVPTSVAFITPGYFSPVIVAGLGGAKNADIANLLSALIHAGFMSSLLNGTAINPVGLVATVVASPII